MQKWLYKNWWVLTINGVIVILLGIFTFRIPLETFEKFIWGFGLLVLLSGIVLIVVSFHNLKKKRSWVLWLFEGIFNLAVGIVILFNKANTVDLLLIFLGIWAILLGLVEGFISIKMKKEQSGKKLLLFNAFLCIAFGIILFYNPLTFGPVLKMVARIIALLAGIITIYISFRLKASSKKLLSDQDDDQLHIENNQAEEIKD